MNARSHMIAKVQQMPTTEIIALINANAALMTPEADIIIEVVLQVLELRLPEAQFIGICDKLAA